MSNLPPPSSSGSASSPPPPPPPGDGASGAGSPPRRTPVAIAVAAVIALTVVGAIAVLVAGDEDGESSGPETTAGTDAPSPSSPSSSRASTPDPTTTEPGTTLPSQKPFDTKPIVQVIQRMVEDVEQVDVERGCPMEHFDEVVDAIADTIDYGAFSSGVRLDPLRSIDPGTSDLPSVGCSVTAVSVAKGGRPELPDDPSVLPRIEVTITAKGAGDDTEPANAPGIEHQGSNRGGNIYLVTRQSIAGYGVLWIDPNISITLQISGRDSRRIDPSKLTTAIVTSLDTIISDAAAM